MNKEHAGGKPKIAIEYRASMEDGPVAVQDFDFSQLDSLADLILEAATAGRPIEPMIEEMFRQREMEIRIETLNRLIEYMLTSDRPKWTAYQLAFACGMHITLGLSGPEIAKSFGDSKQAFFQGVERIREELQLRKTISMRDEEAREHMSKTHYRPVKAAGKK